MTDHPSLGRSLVTRRAVVDIVRAAVRTSYGVTAVDAGPFERLLGALRLREPGIRVRLRPGLEIDVALVVGHGLPIAEVARQVDSAVRYAVRRAIDREVERLTIHVGGLQYHPASLPPAPAAGREEPAAASPPDGPGDGSRPAAEPEAEASAAARADVA